MQTYTHKCRCGKDYTDTDPDIYLCADCIAEKQKIAAQIDAQIANRPSKRQAMSDYQTALEKGQVMGRGLFVRASDLGL